jgi:hypothetical protein
MGIVYSVLYTVNVVEIALLGKDEMAHQIALSALRAISMATPLRTQPLSDASL